MLSTSLTSLIPLLEVFPLPIFPESGLSRSIITTVFIGLVIMVYFNEAFGWVLSGLVVPGYLAPILIIQPWSGGVIVAEAVITHILVRGFSDYLSRAGPAGLGLWRQFFGRDRFFAYLLFGVLVRALGEGYLFHEVGAFLNRSFGLSIDYRNNFYSIGLIVVPLLGNMFWKPGLKGGAVPIAVSVGLTYAFIRWVLIPFTNYSISSFELSYGYYATSFLGNAKAYIILLTTAYMASRMNLRYGWDYNGILIPSLLALAWFNPSKVVTSLLEAILILKLTRWVTARKIMSSITIEGGRRLLLCFSIGYALKMVVGFAVGFWYPGFEAGELYGFGYLLPSLIANKMNQKGSVGLVLRPLVQTSLAGAATGTIGAAALLYLLPVAEPVSPADPQAIAAAPSGEEPPVVDADLFGKVLADKVRLVRRDDRKGVDLVYGRELEIFRGALRLIQDAQRHPPDSPAARARLAEAAARLRGVGYAIERVRVVASAWRPESEARLYYYVRETASSPGTLHGWGLYIFDAAPRTELVIEVPRPFADWKAVECGAALFDRLAARALLVAGAHPLASWSGAADVLSAPGSIFQAAHSLHAKLDVLQVRGEPDLETAVRAGGTDPQPHAADAPPLRLYHQGPLPLDLRFREGPHSLEAIAGAEPELVPPSDGRHERVNLQRETSLRWFGSLAVSAEGARRIIGAQLRGQHVSSAADIKNIDGYLLTWLQETKALLAASGSEAYVKPKLSELIYMDEEVLAPLVRLQRRTARGEPLDEEGLRLVARAADHLDYEVVRYTYSYSGARFLILRERVDRPRRYRGMFVFRLGRARPYALEVPYPVTDYHTFEAGARLFEFLEAEALVIAGASRFANADGSADVSSPRFIESFFQLAHQVIVRESEGAVLAVSVRGFSSQSSDPGLDIVLSTGRELKRRIDVPAAVVGLEGELRRLGAAVGYFDGSRRTLRFQGGQTAQWGYSDVHFPGTFVYCWLSSEFREAFRDRLPESAGEAALPDVGLPRTRGNLLAFVEVALRERTGPGAARAARDAPARALDARAAIELLRRYVRTENVIYLAEAKALAGRAGGLLTHFLDVSSNREYFVLAAPPGVGPELIFVANPHAARREEARFARDRADLFIGLAEAVTRGYETIAVTEAGPAEAGKETGR